MADYDPELVKQALAEKDKEIERLNGDLKCVRQLQDTFWAALKKLNLASIYVSNPGLHFTERIAALEAENGALELKCYALLSMLPPNTVVGDIRKTAEKVQAEIERLREGGG